MIIFCVDSLFDPSLNLNFVLRFNLGFILHVFAFHPLDWSVQINSVVNYQQWVSVGHNVFVYTDSVKLLLK